MKTKVITMSASGTQATHTWTSPAQTLSHALELWTAIERSPEVKLVVNVNDYIVKEETFPCPHCKESYPWPNEGQRDYHMAIKHPKEFGARVRELIAEADEFADCKHKPIAKEDCDLREFDLEEMA